MAKKMEKLERYYVVWWVLKKSRCTICHRRKEEHSRN